MNTSLINDFDTSGLDSELTVVRCKTQEEADIFLEYLRLKGVWRRDQIRKLSRRWKDYCGTTCYHLSLTSWCYDEYYYRTRPNWQIVDFCDIYCPQTSNPLEIALGFDELFS